MIERPAVDDGGPCPLRELLDRIGDRWSVLVVVTLGDRTLRFGRLRREVGAISPRVLADTLRGLGRDGLVSRRAYPTVPVTVEYALTPLGLSLSGPLGALNDWALAHRDAILRARSDHDAEAARDRDAHARPRTRS